MRIRKFTSNDAQQAVKLIVHSFTKTVAKEYSKKGQASFLKEETMDRYREIWKTRDLFVAEHKGKIVGIIEGNRKDTITRLFVHPKYFRMGVANTLMKRIEAMFRRRGITKVRVFSSLFAITFYEKSGFKKSRGLITYKNGMICQPMRKVL